MTNKTDRSCDTCAYDDSVREVSSQAYAAMLKDFSAHNSSKLIPYSTLDDVPSFAIETMNSLHVFLRRQFAGMTGISISGSQQCGSAMALGDSYWGRNVTRSNGGLFYMRFYPKLENGRRGDHTMYILNTKLVTKKMDTYVCTLVLYNDAASPNVHKSGNAACDGSEHDIFFPQESHSISLGLLRSHDPFQGGTHSHEQYDAFNLKIIPGCLFSVYNPSIMVRHDHVNCAFFDSGATASHIACELLSIPHEIKNVRTVQPILGSLLHEYRDRWMRETKNCNLAIDPVGAQSRLLRSYYRSRVITSMLSLESLVGLRSHRSMKNALPEYLSGDSGLFCTVSMMLRMVMRYSDFNMPRPEQDTCKIIEHVRHLFETTTQRPLESGKTKKWAIDIVLETAFENCRIWCESNRTGCGASSSRKAQKKNATMVHFQYIFNDCKIFWFHILESMLRDLFDYKPLDVSEQAAARIPTFRIASRERCRGEIVRMLRLTETWLRTGVQSNGRLTRNTSLSDTQKANTILMQMSKFSNIPISELEPLNIMKHLNIQAAVTAAIQGEEAFKKPFQADMNSDMWVRLFDESQHTRCSECDTEVDCFVAHVLLRQHSHCTACFAPRCLKCASAFEHELNNISSSGPVGMQCKRCGAPPVFAHVHNVKHEELRTGYSYTTLHVQLEQRTPSRFARDASGAAGQSSTSAS